MSLGIGQEEVSMTPDFDLGLADVDVDIRGEWKVVATWDVVEALRRGREGLEEIGWKCRASEYARFLMELWRRSARHRLVGDVWFGRDEYAVVYYTPRAALLIDLIDWSVDAATDDGYICTPPTLPEPILPPPS